MANMESWLLWGEDSSPSSTMLWRKNPRMLGSPGTQPAEQQCASPGDAKGFREAEERTLAEGEKQQKQEGKESRRGERKKEGKRERERRRTRGF
jgi:hypothetical protein